MTDYINFDEQSVSVSGTGYPDLAIFGETLIAKEWLDKVEAKCNAVVDSYTDLYHHVGTIEELDGFTEDELEEVSAVVAVKLMRMENKVEAILFPEPDNTQVLGEIGGVQ